MSKKKNSRYRESIRDLFCRFTLYSKEDFVFSSPVGDALKYLKFAFITKFSYFETIKSQEIEEKKNIIKGWRDRKSVV